MASKNAIYDLIENISETFGTPFSEKKILIWVEILSGDDYPDKLLKDAFTDHCEKQNKTMMICDIATYRSNNYFKYRELDKFNRDW
jgi:hypothetical protein